MEEQCGDSHSRDDVREELEKALDEIRPFLQADGGDVQLMDYDAESGVVSVQLKGACFGCPMAMVTLQMGILQFLQERLDAIKVKDVVAV